MKRLKKYRDLTEAEKQVCQRFRQSREAQGFSQAFISEHIGLSRDQLARVEAGSVAPLFGPAWRLCQFLALNPLWLAFGDRYSSKEWIDYHFAPEHTIEEGERFLDVMRRHETGYADFRQSLQRARGEYVFANARRIPSADDGFGHRLEQFTNDWRKTIPREDREKFVMHLALAAKNFAAKKNLAGRLVKHYLTTMPNDLPLNWEQLKARVLRLIERPGERARLAEELGVTRSAISQLLSSSPRPTADKTLKLLAWVAEAEANNKKSADRAETRPAPATRKSKSTSHEKAKSDRRKS